MMPHATPKDEDYLLFSDHLRQLEKKILPGLSKLNWGTKALLIERFVEVSKYFIRMKNTRSILQGMNICRTLSFVSFIPELHQRGKRSNEAYE